MSESTIIELRELREKYQTLSQKLEEANQLCAAFQQANVNLNAENSILKAQVITLNDEIKLLDKMLKDYRRTLVRMEETN